MTREFSVILSSMDTFRQVNSMHNKNLSGFTLIELMIVISVIGIISAIAIPAYQSYAEKTIKRACLWEVKGYANQAFLAINDQDDDTYPNQPSISACQTITDASKWSFSNQKVIEATAKSPSNAQIKCDLPNGSACRILE